MSTKGNCEKLDMVWARAHPLAHAGLPPGIEDEYIRDDILQTSLAKAPYTVCMHAHVHARAHTLSIPVWPNLHSHTRSARARACRHVHTRSLE